MRRTMIVVLVALLTATGGGVVIAGEFDVLTENQNLEGFRVETVYDDGAGGAIGARFVHANTGCTVDLLRIQSVPQAFMYVNSPPTSDMGEPHTCEHLLLGKGNRGRYVASLEDMSLGNSSAFTMQRYTCYNFHTAGSADVFFNLLDKKLEALLQPTFSDEEIRREVCNIGIRLDPGDGTLHLEEKGTVYNEMVSSSARPWYSVSRALDTVMYGPDHPLAYVSGGDPAAIREMTPADLRVHHRDVYRLSNLGMVVSVPREIPLDEFLSNAGTIFDRLEPADFAKTTLGRLGDNLPAPTPGPAGSIQLAAYPHRNPEEPGLMVFAWPPTLELSNDDLYLLQLFVQNLTDGETSVLYKRFIDSQSRTMDIGATSVFGWVSDDLGHPVYIGFSNVKRAMLTEQMIDSVRGIVMNEIAAAASWADGSQELATFNAQAADRVLARRRSQREFLSAPPRFGFRHGSAAWMNRVRHLEKNDGFRKSLMLDSELEHAGAALRPETNAWRTLVADWQLVSSKPHAVGAVANPDLIARQETEREGRLDAYLDGLKKRFKTDDDQEAIRRYQAEYEEKTREIADEAAKIAMPGFLDNPPLVLDEQLDYEVTTIAGEVPFVRSTFENLQSATVGIALRMDVTPPELLTYVPILPTLLTETGVTIDGEKVAYDDMARRLRQEILGLAAYYGVNARTERVELAVRARGGEITESERALDWLAAALFAPDLSAGNLPRLRDVVDQTLSGARNRMKRSEESWVHEPSTAYWRQANPLYLSANCFLTEAHHLLRLRWMLKESPSQEDAAVFGAIMQQIAMRAGELSRAELDSILTLLAPETGDLSGIDARLRLAVSSLSEDGRGLLADAVQDLQTVSSDIPDESLGADIAYLCAAITSDLNRAPEEALVDINRLLDLIRVSGNARVYAIGSRSSHERLQPKIEAVIERLDDSRKPERVAYADDSRIIDRLRDRVPGLSRPVFVGLVDPNTRSGVFLNSTPIADHTTRDRETLLRSLAGRLYGGGGAHSMFMKTWGAGLAYSNGLRCSTSSGNLTYYAERCPDLTQTLRFVADELRDAPVDDNLAEYAVAQVFGVYRSGAGYETRGEAMAADIADGLTEDVVRGFRQAILELRASPNLTEDLRARMLDVYGRVVPGLNGAPDGNDEDIHFVIGPEKQLESYQDYITGIGSEETLHRLYPRDFWLVPEAD